MPSFWQLKSTLLPILSQLESLGPTYSPLICLSRRVPKRRGPTIFMSYSNTALMEPGRTRYKHKAFLSVGSNVGDRLLNIESACKLLDSTKDIRLLRTSGLWETEPMYVLNQGCFLNAVLEVTTSLGPFDLLKALQSVENALGRVREIPKGPRTLDLDILLFDNRTLQAESLTIPHMNMLEREFVLRPLCELIPDGKLPQDASPEMGVGTDQSFSHFLLKLVSDQKISMSSYTPLGGGASPLRPLSPRKPTQIMAIMNTTPDSFSDGGQILLSDRKGLETTIHSHVASGASILDIGGQSTRPGAAPVTSDEEIARVLPAIDVIRKSIDSRIKQSQGSHLAIPAISVDTYRSEVADRAVEAGADIINDISAGMLDDGMFKVAAKHGCTIVLSHLRGNPQTMSKPPNTVYCNGSATQSVYEDTSEAIDLISTIRAELAERVRAAENAGIRRWRIILDPGIGFAKVGTQNCTILRLFDELRSGRFDTDPRVELSLKNLPWMVGVSRKKFIGSVTGVEAPSERTIGTAVAIDAGIRGGADLVRVHDTKAMAQAVKMADAIWRGY